MLGTGSALVTRCYNTCFTFHTPEAMLLVDAGGGNGILAQLEKAGIKLGDVHHIFITHAHTDHIIGVLWVLRVYIQYAMSGMIEGQLHIYGHDKSLHVLRTMVELMLPAKLQQQIGTIIVLHELHAGDEWTVGDLNLTCFDILGLASEANGNAGREEAFGQAIDLLLNIRAQAKANKDWATSDRIRNELSALGFEVKDTKDGATWRLNK